MYRKKLLTLVCLHLALSWDFSAAEGRDRGESCGCRPEDNCQSLREEDTCNGAKGLQCLQSYNPQYTGLDSEDPRWICECPEDYYYDPETKECRIQIGYACDPEDSHKDNVDWSRKCPENSRCASDIGPYAPAGAKGVCRCNDGFYVVSQWYVGGGGSICVEDTNDVEVDSSDPKLRTSFRLDQKLKKKFQDYLQGRSVEYDN